MVSPVGGKVGDPVQKKIKSLMFGIFSMSKAKKKYHLFLSISKLVDDTPKLLFISSKNLSGSWTFVGKFCEWFQKCNTNFLRSAKDQSKVFWTKMSNSFGWDNIENA